MSSNTTLKRTKIATIKGRAATVQDWIGKEVLIKGWVRTVRAQKTFAFIEVNDGSTLSGMQAVADASLPNYQEVLDQLSTGAAVAISGEVKESPGKGQSVELQVHELTVVGTCDSDTYPLQKKRHSFEFLRSIAHLRPRTNTLGAVTRVRNALAYATHQFFQDRGFLYVHTPVITASDCEGAGQMFQVTTQNLQQVPTTQDGKVDHSKDFFKRPTYLTVSGQLEGEIYACALSDIYTFGPTFRAENSNTSRHLAEFWMIEPEMAFADLNDNQDCAEAYLKHCIRTVLERCPEDMELFDKFVQKGIIQTLEAVTQAEFERVSYTEAVSILEKSGKKWEYPVSWGKDLQSEHERYLTEEHFKKPVILTNYPKSFKPFYMRCNDDDRTVAAMDVLVPGVGEIIGGSQREERIDILEARMDSMDLDKEEYWWYRDLRKYGSVPHSGFGLGFERLVQFATGMENIRDVIPFPRVPGHAEF